MCSHEDLYGVLKTVPHKYVTVVMKCAIHTCNADNTSELMYSTGYFVHVYCNSMAVVILMPYYHTNVIVQSISISKVQIQKSP